ncbi:hypothetical protein BO78DRAFT_443343 [Aspergillus sclerotiicarbonarius CBS 121057]|uniref:Uncharacterized protein n=1 Tax=Aspergillus sclerotiicarbonarius (strain CBS 121057 / IBT 28362) TaxID=1448318 RepID=A0A319EBE3_ASPSB|nr:hypothetical protein BO78DRAFT_443343 [Aspergillus sclerotiicarbonarius CBS 121057]
MPRSMTPGAMGGRVPPRDRVVAGPWNAKGNPPGAGLRETGLVPPRGQGMRLHSSLPAKPSVPPVPASPKPCQALFLSHANRSSSSPYQGGHILVAVDGWIQSQLRQLPGSRWVGSRRRGPRAWQRSTISIVEVKALVQLGDCPEGVTGVPRKWSGFQPIGPSFLP